jgi:hypothetical protein
MINHITLSEKPKLARADEVWKRKKKPSQAGMLIIAALEQLQAMGADYDKPLNEQPLHIKATWAAMSDGLDALLPHLNKQEWKRYKALKAQIRRSKSDDQSFSA